MCFSTLVLPFAERDVKGYVVIFPSVFFFLVGTYHYWKYARHFPETHSQMEGLIKGLKAPPPNSPTSFGVTLF